MSAPDSIETLLARLELHDPPLGALFRTSPHVAILAAGRSELSSWEAGPLSYFSGAGLLEAFRMYVELLRLPPKLYGALEKGWPSGKAGGWPQVYYPFERVERVRVNCPEIELRYSSKNGHFQLRLVAPKLGEPDQQAVVEWLAASKEAPLEAIARGDRPESASLSRLGLVPTWDSLTMTCSSRSQTALELGVKFLCRALAVYPAYLVIWRGLDGPDLLRQFVAARLAERQNEFLAAVAELPGEAADFWAAPPLPELPPPHELTPDPGLSAHLPPAAFWPSAEDNRMFMDALAKVYKNAQKKLTRLTQW